MSIAGKQQLISFGVCKAGVCIYSVREYNSAWSLPTDKCELKHDKEKEKHVLPNHDLSWWMKTSLGDYWPIMSTELSPLLEQLGKWNSVSEFHKVSPAPGWYGIKSLAQTVLLQCYKSAEEWYGKINKHRLKNFEQLNFYFFRAF